MSKLLGPKPIRALLFVQTLNEQGINVSESDVDAFIEARTHYVDLDPYAEFYRSTVTYLTDARLLVKKDGCLTLSPAGRAILRAQDSTAVTKEDASPVEVVGRMSDPFVYAELLSRIDDVADSMIIDPYLHPRDLMALLKLSTVRRVLTRDISVKGMKKNERTQKIKIALGARPDVELRLARGDSGELHDRLIIPGESGESLFLGTSLGGTQITVITRLGVGPTSALRGHYNTVWDSSTKVVPIERVVQDH